MIDEINKIYDEQNQKWFYYENADVVIKSNPDNIYASNIGDFVLRINCSSHLTEEQAMEIVKQWKVGEIPSAYGVIGWTKNWRNPISTT